MKNIEIVRGYRSFGHEDVYASNPAVEIVEGDIVTPAGDKATLSGDTAHKECGLSIERNYLNGRPKDSGKTPVYVSNFTFRTSYYVAGTYAVNDPITVTDGQPTKADVAADSVWGYVTAVNTDGTLDIRVNY